MTATNWNTTIDELHPRLFRYFLGSFDRDRSHDLVQEVFLRLVNKEREGRIDQQKGNTASFAFGIAHNLRKEAFRSHRAGILDIDKMEIAESSTTREFDREEKMSQLREAIQKLKEQERQIILLMIDQELSLLEISDIVGMPVGTIGSHIHRAKEKLKSILGQGE